MSTLSVAALIQLDDDDADYLAEMAKESGLGLGQLCASIVAMVIADDRVSHKREDDAA